MSQGVPNIKDAVCATEIACCWALNTANQVQIFGGSCRLGTSTFNAGPNSGSTTIQAVLDASPIARCARASRAVLLLRMSSLQLTWLCTML